MEIRDSSKLKKHDSRLRSLPNFEFRVGFFAFLLVVGCGAPGDPTPPTPLVPVAIVDLTAHQAGDGVQLVFTLPTDSISGEKLPSPPAIEILRGSLKADGSPDTRTFRIVYTIPGELSDNYLSEGHVNFIDPIGPEETKAHPGAAIAYIVRTRASKKRASPDSNVVSLPLFAVPERIASLVAKVTESAIELSWSAPTRTSSGDPLPPPSGYRIYRTEKEGSGASSSVQIPAQTKAEMPAAPLAFSETDSYRDTSFSFDHTYVYIVRSVIQAGGNLLESSDSEPVTVTPRDVFPPAAPQGVVAALLPGSAPGSVVVDISWSINLETDLAGYRVYRSEQEGARGQLLTPDLLLTPAVRDTSVQPGHRYWYTVTAVDRVGNESAPSEPVAVDVTQPAS